MSLYTEICVWEAGSGKERRQMASCRRFALVGGRDASKFGETRYAIDDNASEIEFQNVVHAQGSTESPVISQSSIQTERGGTSTSTCTISTCISCRRMVSRMSACTSKDGTEDILSISHCYLITLTLQALPCRFRPWSQAYIYLCLPPTTRRDTQYKQIMCA